MKTHFGIIYNCGDYESPLMCCDETLCGYDGEEVCEIAVDDWELVTCKKCLRLKEPYRLGQKEDEKAIVQQMGEMGEMEKGLTNVNTIS